MMAPYFPSQAPSPPNAAFADTPLRRRLRVPLIVVGALILIAAGVVITSPETKSEGTMLGASGTVTGGNARINGVIPMEIDGWLPDRPAAVLTESAGPGTHRVRIILELTALDPEGLAYSADDFTITGLGSVDSRQVWADPQSVTIAQGEVVTATQVYELPNEAVELLLQSDDVQFLLGTEHHTG